MWKWPIVNGTSTAIACVNPLPAWESTSRLVPCLSHSYHFHFPESYRNLSSNLPSSAVGYPIPWLLAAIGCPVHRSCCAAATAPWRAAWPPGERLRMLWSSFNESQLRTPKVSASEPLCPKFYSTYFQITYLIFPRHIRDRDLGIQTQNWDDKQSRKSTNWDLHTHQDGHNADSPATIKSFINMTPNRTPL